jgi:hypothetical protein
MQDVEFEDGAPEYTTQPVSHIRTFMFFTKSWSYYSLSRLIGSEYSDGVCFVLNDVNAYCKLCFSEASDYLFEVFAVVQGLSFFILRLL